MYGRVEEGRLTLIKNGFVNCKVERNGLVYYVSGFNLPGEELEELGYYPLSPEAEEATGTDAVFVVAEGLVKVAL